MCFLVELVLLVAPTPGFDLELDLSQSPATLFLVMSC